MYQDYYDNEQQPEVHPISQSYGRLRGVARCSLYVCGALSAALLVRLIDALMPVYAIAAGTGIAIWLGTLALAPNDDKRAFALTVGSLMLGGTVLGWWDWIAEVFSTLGGEKVFIQVAVVLGVAGLVFALRESLKGARRQQRMDGGYIYDPYQQ